MLSSTNYRSKIVFDIAKLLGISKDDAERIFNILESDYYPYRGNELKVLRNEADNQGLIFQEGLFSINIKIITLHLIAMALDLKVTKSFASSALTISGLGGQGIAVLDEKSGERCIAREAILHKQINKQVLQLWNKECVNNDLNCRFREAGKCVCTIEETEFILKKLEQENVLEKADMIGYYKVSF